MVDDTTMQAVVIARFDDLRGAFEDLRDEVREARQSVVSRGEWGQRNAHVDTRLDSQGREIGQLRAELSARRAPWWSTWAVVLAAAGFAWSVLGDAIRGV